ncbi:MAG: hypothetical protein NC213_08160 [Acetobacter sp.]|nr:hypothetical protein [Bacteroides sp.]MCM1341703.1 hypothetical protein [Acetobacter sp.]MCM1432358.1 hypothetical protein [Clostridiales bacterium]
MTDNFSSNRIDYLSFEYNEEIKENPYLNQFSKPIDSNSVILLTKNYKSGLNNVTAIIKKLKHKKKTVYVREYFAEDFKKYSFVKPVKPKTDEYYEALATSKYVYTEIPLFANFVKRDGQFVFNNIPKQKSEFESRINLYLTKQKSSYFINDNNPDNDYSFKDFLKIVSKDKPKEIIKDCSKKQLLVLFNPSDYKFSLDYVMNIISQLDFNKYNLTLLIDNKYINQYKNILSSFDKKVNIILKKGRILCTPQIYRKMLFLRKEHSYIDDYSNINEFLPSTELKYESKRIFGDLKFDKAINIGHDTFYWCRLLKSVCSNINYIDNKGYLSSKPEYKKGKYKFLTDNYSVIFENILIRSSAEEADNKFESAPLIDYIPRKSFDSNNIKRISIGNIEGLVIHSLNIDNLDTLNAVVISADCIGSDYLLASNTQLAEDIAHTAKLLSKDKNKFIIFDFFDIMSSGLEIELKAENIFVIKSYSGYMALLDNLGNGYVIENCQNGIYYDAVERNKQISLCDIDGSIIKTIESNNEFVLNL